MAESTIPRVLLPMVQERLGYTDDEMARFAADPRNARVLAKAAEMREKTFVFEVVDSRGCNSQHLEGTRLYFSGDGNLITKWAPKRVCAFLLPVCTQMIFALQELWYAGVDPNEACFRRGGCFDVGIACGGWGHVVIEGRLVGREEARALVDG